MFLFSTLFLSIPQVSVKNLKKGPCGPSFRIWKLYFTTSGRYTLTDMVLSSSPGRKNSSPP